MHRALTPVIGWIAIVCSSWTLWKLLIVVLVDEKERVRFGLRE